MAFDDATSGMDTERLAPDIDEMVELLACADGPDPVAAVFTRYRPPTDEMGQAVAREKLLKALVGKLRAPAKLVDAWLGSATRGRPGRPLLAQAGRLLKLAMSNAELFHDPGSDRSPR